jgi:twitching motility protein PilT
MTKYSGFYNRENFHKILKKVVEIKATDLFLIVRNFPVVRDNRDGKIYSAKKYFQKDFDLPRIEKEDTEFLKELMLSQRGIGASQDYKDFNFSYEADGARFRVNLNRNVYGMGFVMRRIPPDVPSIESLNYTPMAEMRMKHIAKEFDRGLILVTGPTGCGKSTTLAAMIREMKLLHHYNIVTIEDPIEFVYKPEEVGENFRVDNIIQREVGLDTPSFYDGLKNGLRQNPNAILVGEIRTEDVMEETLAAANAGHLLMGTLHANDSRQAIEQVAELLPSYKAESIYKKLANVLIAIISQRLLPKQDESARIPSCEILIRTPTIVGLLQEGQILSIKDYLRGNPDRPDEPLSYFDELYYLAKKGIISEDLAKRTSASYKDMDLILRGIMK